MAKVKAPLYFTEHHAKKAYWGMEIWLHTFLTSALDGGEWSASQSDLFTPRETPVPIG
jgi:hypothetical protein